MCMPVCCRYCKENKGDEERHRIDGGAIQVCCASFKAS